MNLLPSSSRSPDEKGPRSRSRANTTRRKQRAYTHVSVAVTSCSAPRPNSIPGRDGQATGHRLQKRMLPQNLTTVSAENEPKCSARDVTLISAMYFETGRNRPACDIVSTRLLLTWSRNRDQGSARCRFSATPTVVRPTRSYRLTRPETSPPISFSTSGTRTILKSPGTECFRHEAATAKSRTCCLSSYVFSP